MWPIPPFAYKAIAAVLLCAGLFGTGYWKGSASKQHQIDVIEAQAAAELSVAKIQAKAIDDQHQKEMQDAKDQYEKDVANARHYFQQHPTIRLCDNNSSSNSLSQTDSGSQETNGATSTVPSGPSPTGGFAAVYQLDCTVVALRLKNLQDLLKRDGVEVQ